MLTIERTLERIKSDNEEELPNVEEGTTMKADYVWEQLVKAAALETDDEKLPKLIQAAKAAIDDRLHELQSDNGGAPDERQAISDALAPADKQYMG